MEIGRRKNQAPLIIEAHPCEYEGYPFITLIQYRDSNLLSVIDNSDNKLVKAFVLDLCGPADVNEEQFISIAGDWYDAHYPQYPLSFHFSKIGVSNKMSNIFRTFNIDFISRIIGPLPKFSMGDVNSTKKRRRKTGI